VRHQVRIQRLSSHPARFPTTSSVFVHGNVTPDCSTVIAVDLRVMTDLNEINALKASFLGALDTAALLEALRDKVIALDPGAQISGDDLDELGRATLAHAVSSQALRGFVESMRARRSA